jgi:predicted RNA methylase
MTTLTTPTDLKSLLTVSREIFTNGTTFDQYKAFSSYLLDNPESVKAIISKETISSLSRFCWHKDKKDRMVSSVYSTICQNLTLSDSFQYSPMEETFEAALRRILSGYNEEQYLQYKAKLQAEREQKEKALNNPETLEEFRTFISRKGEAALSADQRIKYDELTADSRKAMKQREEERAAQVKAVENVDAEMTIKESHHAKKNIPLWVVVLNTRVERSVYLELNDRAKKLGGYYSSYKGQGAIPGFTFESKEAAELFTEVKNGNVDASEIKTEQKEDKQQSRAEILKEKGEAMINAGNEDLGRDRQANTARRARFAASAENKASGQIEFGKTLVKIAEMMEAGEIKYLDKVSNLKDLEELQSVLSVAKNKHIVDKKLNRDQYEINLDTVNYCRLPFPVIYTSNSGEIMRMAENSNGKKQAAARMLKRLKGVEFIEVNNPQRLEDYKTIFCSRCSVIDSWRVDSYKEQLMRLKRINRIGIDTIEELRAAIRELLNLKKGATITADQKRDLEIKGLERKFLHSQIPGFFPTPKTLGSYVVSLAEIKEGEKVCEPSAGLGHLADEIKEAAPDCELQCIEQNNSLCEALELKGYNTLNEDFLQHTGKYDVIVMNPPFENGQDVEHVEHAFKLLNEGGRLVAIMANNKYRYPLFMEMVNKHGYFEENAPKSFASAFRPTGVSTITVYLSN